MSLFGRLVPNLLTGLRPPAPRAAAPFHQLTSSKADPSPGGLFALFTRTIIRNHFPRPSERQRIKRHGWKHRLSTADGRRILMNRILKGRHVYSH